MRFVTSALVCALSIASASGAALEKRGSNSWAGTNVYFLQGISSDAQDSYISNLKDFGIKVVRVWVNAQTNGGCEKGNSIVTGADNLEDTIGDYQNNTMNILDTVINKIANAGMKVIISPHDGNSVGSGTSRPDVYQNTFGSENFYTDQTAMSDYDNRLTYILNYVSPSSGKAWKEWSDAIAGFDIENEPFQFANDLCKNNDQAGWLCGRAQHMRSVLGDSPIKIGTGGIGGDDSKGCTMMQAALDCSAVDMISIHRYAGNEANGANPNEWSGELSKYLGQTSKLLYVEEFGFSSSTSDQTTEWAMQTGDINKAGVPWMYWELLPDETCDYDCGSDCYGIFVSNTKVDIKGQVGAADGMAAAQDWTGIIY